MKRELTWFQQSFEAGTVSYNVVTVEEDGYRSGRDYHTTTAVLELRADQRGRSTWDEQDILDHHAATTGQADVVLAESQAARQAKLDAEARAALAEPSPVAEIGAE